MQHNKFLVMDSGGFIRGFHHLDQFYSEYEMSSIPGVMQEIRDRKTRNKLESGVFEVHLRSPHPDALKLTVDFCKATGDYAALSTVDIKVMALAVTVEMEKNGRKFIKAIPPTPEIHRAQPITSNKSDLNPLAFYKVPTSQPTKIEEKAPTKIEKKTPTSSLSEDKEPEVEKKATSPENNVVEKEVEDNTNQGSIVEDDQIEEDSEEDEDAEEGWITPDNFTSVIHHANKPDVEEDRVFVACCTTDFAMQNVLLQMGIKLLSIDGLQIRNVRNWTLRCFSCRRVSAERDRVFCKYCGNKTMRKISIFIDESGEVKYVTPRRKISTRGTMFSLPKPKPGRANKPNGQVIVSEFQWNKGNHGGNKRKELDMMDVDFSFTRKKANTQMSSGSRSNPNQVKKTGGKNKRNRRRR